MGMYITSLKDGRKVILRPIGPEDEPLWEEMFRTLSEESIRYRYFETIKEIPYSERVRYCNNTGREIGIVAELNDEGHRKIIGDARTIIQPEIKNNEIDFIVADQWQGQGLGLKIVHYMIEICRYKKLETINALLLPDNTRAIRLLKKLGFFLEYFDDETLKATLGLERDDPIKLISQGVIQEGIKA